MGTRTGRQGAALAAALLLTVAACAQPPTAPGAATTGAALLTRTATPSQAARPTTAPVADTASVSTASVSTASATTAPATTAPATAPGPVTSGAGQVVSPLPSCTAATLPTAVRGTLTFVVGDRSGAPWIIGNPSQGQGLEAAVGAAVAARLGFRPDAVVWRSAPTAAVQAAKVAGADVGLGEFRIPDQATGAVDYSTGYFSISDSVVARTGTPAAEVTGLPALSRLRVAALARPSAGAAGLDSPATTAFPSASDALGALRRGAVDVAVVPTPAAVTAGPDITVLGQLSKPSEQPAQFGMVLAKSSPLTACVSAAIDQLRVTGALAAMVQRWVPAANRPLDRSR